MISIAQTEPVEADERAPRRRVRAAVLATSIALSGVAAVATAVAAHADPAKWEYSFDTPGVYSFTIPSVATEAIVGISGAGGGDGGSTLFASGGRGGGGFAMDPDLPVGTGSVLRPGETLTIVVGKQGTGGSGGSGSLVGATGGTGGGASAIFSDTGTIIAVASGGGGGGGAGGFVGGTGGTGNGGPGGKGSSPAAGGAAGTNGANLTCGPDNRAAYFAAGVRGQDAPDSSDSGGGGGGGGGACGGGGGQTTDGGAGGGGGGAGGNVYDPNWVYYSGRGTADPGSDGRVDVILSVNASQNGVTFTSPNAATVSADQIYFSQPVTTVAPPNTSVTYALADAPSWLSIDPATGLLSTQGMRAAGGHGVVRFHVLATASAPGTAPQTYAQDFTLTVNQAPAFTSAPQTLSEPAAAPFTANVTATSYPAPVYSLNAAAPSWLSINPTTGVLTGHPPLGSQGSYSFGVVAGDGVDPFALQMMRLTITIPPLAITTGTRLPDAVSGHAYSQTLGWSGGNGAVRWSLASGALPAGLTLSPAGVLGGTDTAAAGVQSFVVRVTDTEAAAQSVTEPMSILTRPAALASTSPSTITPVVGVAYSRQLTASGGYPPYSWSLAAGTALPPGLTVTSAGVLSGRPTTAATTTVHLVLSDLLQSVPVAVNVTVAPRLVPVIPANLQTVRGVAYSRQLSASGGTGTLHWAVATGSHLPAGLVLSATGLLAGTPSTVDSRSVGFVVSDSAHTDIQRVTGASTVSVVPPKLGLTRTASLVATLGAAYTHQLAAVGGTGAYHWSLGSGSRLPAGLRLNSATGIISGLPTVAGTSTAGVVVTDSGTPTPQRATRAYTINVPSRPVPDLTVALTHTGTFASGRSGAWTVTASNHGTAGSAAVTVQLVLPPGVGQPTLAGASWQCTLVGRTVTCTHTGIASGATIEALRATVPVTAPAGSALTATATITPTDIVAANNTASDTVTVLPT